MIWHDVEGGTPEWARLRLGIPCSSDFDKLLTPKTLKLSKQSDTFMYRLLAEWVTGVPCEDQKTEWMVRGTELEATARKAYELLTETKVTNGGFFTTDDGLIGCSPDGLIGENGDLELKCPLIQTQLRYALTGEIDSDYMAQIQGRLMIHEREWVDIFSYHPLMMIPPVRVVRDDKFIDALRSALGQFIEQMLKCREWLEQNYGPFTRPTDLVEPAEPGPLGITDEDVAAIVESKRHLWQ